jgi:hypothetical protein
VNLIALATIEAGSDAPNAIRLWMAPVSGGGRQCTSFEDCLAVLEQGLQIDYNGRSRARSSSRARPVTRRGRRSCSSGSTPDGAEIDRRVFEAP